MIASDRFRTKSLAHAAPPQAPLCRALGLCDVSRPSRHHAIRSQRIQQNCCEFKFDANLILKATFSHTLQLRNTFAPKIWRYLTLVIRSRAQAAAKMSERGGRPSQKAGHGCGQISRVSQGQSAGKATQGHAIPNQHWGQTPQVQPETSERVRDTPRARSHVNLCN